MRARLAGPALCISLLLVAACGRPPAAPSAEAERILAETASFYQRQSSYRVRSRLEATLHDKFGIAIQEAEPVVDDRTIIVRNTDEFCVEAGQLRFASDGIHLRLNPVQRAAQSDQPGSEKVPYWRADAPARLSEMTSSPLASLLRAPRSLACLGFFDPGLETLLRKNGELVALEGRETVGGVAAHHLTIKLPVSDSAPRAMDVTEVWVAAEGDPVVLQMKVSPAPQLRQFDRGQVECSTYTLETFQGWEFDTDGPPGAFGPPENGRRVAELRELIDGRSPMIGEPAPPTSLQLLDGTTESLEELRAAGKIVLLDFWATWCGPCRTELPFVAQIAEEFGGQGVILYGVNQQESADQVRRFMEEQTYRMTAALDETGAIGNAFQVQSLPSLFIIGRDGTVQVQHVGIGPDTEKAIRDEVAALAAGRNVAADGLPDEDSEPSE